MLLIIKIKKILFFYPRLHDSQLKRTRYLCIKVPFFLSTLPIMTDVALTELKAKTSVQDITPFVSYIFDKVGPTFMSRVDPAQIPSLIKEGMELMETFKNNLTGAQRKQVLIDVLKRVVDGSPLSNDQKKWCVLYLDMGASTTIDMISAVAKGLTNINKKCCKSFWCCCC